MKFARTCGRRGGWGRAETHPVEHVLVAGVREDLVDASEVVPRGRAPDEVLLKARLLPAGRYQVRLYVDRTNRLARDRDAVLTEADRAGTLEFDGPWPPGYQPPKTVRFSSP